jgi:hypothetical protein
MAMRLIFTLQYSAQGHVNETILLSRPATVTGMTAFSFHGEHSGPKPNKDGALKNRVNVYTTTIVKSATEKWLHPGVLMIRQVAYFSQNV